jgi:hypothetical protein
MKGHVLDAWQLAGPPPHTHCIHTRLASRTSPCSGGAVSWLGRGGSGENLLNAFDCGRFLQQSYYGIEDGSDWNGKPWRWNP